MNIKFCGFTQKQDVLEAVRLGVDAVGFIFYKASPRYVDPLEVKGIVSVLPPFVQSVGVFVNHSLEEIQHIQEVSQIDLIQLHGDESPELCKQLNTKPIKAFRVSILADLEPIAEYKDKTSAILLDTKSSKAYGGTGECFDWQLAIQAKTFGIPSVHMGLELVTHTDWEPQTILMKQ